MIDQGVLERTLHAALRDGGDFAEVFAEDRRVANARLDDSKVEALVSGRERGAGVRVVRGDTTGYAHTADLSETGLRDAAAAASAAARGTPDEPHVVALERLAVQPTHDVRVLPETVEKARKAEVLQRADEAARAESDSIRQVSVTYADARRRILVANSDGLLAEDDAVRTRFMVNCVAVADTGMQTGLEAPGRSIGFEYFDEIDPEEVARIAAQRALTMLRARPAPAGKLPVVLKRGAGGVLFHEACGHGLEADLVEKDWSVFANHVGDVVASPLVTLVDDGSYAREWGTFAIDDEGTPAQRNVLIENGVLTDYMWDFVRARKEGRATQRQRPARDLPAPPDGAHDQHVPHGGRNRSRGDHPRHAVRPVLRRARWWSGEHRDRRFRVRRHRGVHDRERRDHRPGARRAAHRQRTRDAASRRRGRLRLRHVVGHLRQGRPGCAGVVRAADAAGRRAHRRRHRR